LPGVNTGSKWVLAQFVVLLFIGLAVAFLGGSPQPATTVVAAVLFVAGQAMAVAAAFKMRQYISAHPAPAPGAKLLADGIYGQVRHPMYGGVLLMAAAFAVFDLNVFAAALTVLLGAIFRGKSNYEEGLLVATFLGYADYMRRVPRRFIPWVF
jgi:protein-S-isoprenylcysteine O-methyltransferase Ste14